MFQKFIIKKYLLRKKWLVKLIVSKNTSKNVKQLSENSLKIKVNYENMLILSNIKKDNIRNSFYILKKLFYYKIKLLAPL